MKLYQTAGILEGAAVLLLPSCTTFVAKITPHPGGPGACKILYSFREFSPNGIGRDSCTQLDGRQYRSLGDSGWKIDSDNTLYDSSAQLLARFAVLGFGKYLQYVHNSQISCPNLIMGIVTSPKPSPSSTRPLPSTSPWAIMHGHHGHWKKTLTSCVLSSTVMQPSLSLSN